MFGSSKVTGKFEVFQKPRSFEGLECGELFAENRDYGISVGGNVVSTGVTVWMKISETSAHNLKTGREKSFAADASVLKVCFEGCEV